MSISAHLTELSERHKALDERIKKALQQPAVDELEVNRLKREKLKLKDTMTRLQEKELRH